ncbi:MAG: bifunctional glutamate N-acetyltransferase/amino-acid acetyltransferase ArgJ [Candidatus Omnitrophota bacterium]|nr:bifunctional glutamate N-acetyltransferase/amino-acid acetyltransferase ArgJ [Candidatus Omnitrophota bacterium]
MSKDLLPKGYQANGIHCGLKKKRKDLSLFYSEKPCGAAAVFTRNVVKAAPVILGQELLRKNKGIRAIVVNSGNANCMTGSQGMKDARAMASAMGKLLGVPKETVLVSSTGIIGELMPVKTVIKGMSKIVTGLSREGLQDAADGIMTTDSFRKISSRVFTVGGRKITITGVAKGAGMVKPDMATMLGYVLTDANISRKALKKALHACVDVSLNAITVDGDMSTNDTLALLANGEAGNVLIADKGKDFDVFRRKLESVCRDLAKMIVKDGEGASKFIEVRVKGAGRKVDAKKIAGAVADSLLVKCAVLGGDPNWGRVASSAGSSGVNFDPGKMEISLDGVIFYTGGKAVAHVNRKKTAVFKKKNVRILVDLHSGKEEAVFYSCDISKKYITLNSYYTT